MSPSEEMSLSVNGQSQVPPGFRFHPTEEELLHYYLRKKVAYQKIDLDVIRDVDLNKLEPWDIQEKCKIGSGPQNDWYFFSHKDKKYPTGTRTNRATTAGFWKATGRDKVIYSSLRRIGMRKTLVFYKGRAPHGQKSDWIMHEYRLDDATGGNNSVGDSMSEDGWVVCRVFRKKNYQKSTLDCPNNNRGGGLMDFTRSGFQQRMPNISSDEYGDATATNDDGVLDQILMYMGGKSSCKQEHEIIPSTTTIINNNSNNSSPYPTLNITSQAIDVERFVHLPRLDSPSDSSFTNNININGCNYQEETILDDMFAEETGGGGVCRKQESDWVALDRLVASQLNGQAAETHCIMSFGGSSSSPENTHDNDCVGDIGGGGGGSNTAMNHQAEQYHSSSSDSDLWSFNRSSSSSSSYPLSHLSV